VAAAARRAPDVPGRAKEELERLRRESGREIGFRRALEYESSGGVDSSTVLHYAASEVRSGLKQFCVVRRR